MYVPPQSFEVEIFVVLTPGSLGVKNVHGQCGIVKDHTHMYIHTLCVAEAVALVAQMAVRINLKLSSTTASLSSFPS